MFNLGVNGVLVADHRDLVRLRLGHRYVMMVTVDVPVGGLVRVAPTSLVDKPVTAAIVVHEGQSSRVAA